MYVAMRRFGRKLKELRTFRLMVDDCEFLASALGDGWWGKNQDWMEEYGRFRWTVERKRAFCRMVEERAMKRGRVLGEAEEETEGEEVEGEGEEVQWIKTIVKV